MHKNSKLTKKEEIEKKKVKRISKNDKPKTVKELLGELYADKIFLERILEDDSMKNEKKSSLTKQSKSVKNNTFVSYLDKFFFTRQCSKN